jgi:hypothetical protein
MGRLMWVELFSGFEGCGTLAAAVVTNNVNRAATHAI